jgi:chemotaxis protein MotB
LKLRLGEKETDLSKAQKEIEARSATISELRTDIKLLNETLKQLNSKISGYVQEIERLNRMISDAEETETKHKTKAAALQKEITTLRTKLDDLGKKLADAKVRADKQFKMVQLVDLLGQKEKEIDRLRKLAKYRSEFFAKLEKIFKDVKDISVRGDRFVFQSEILFASGSAQINDNGKTELDKLVKIFKEMESKIPKDLDVIIMVQGHTDDVPIQSGYYRSNWELASARAMHVVRYLVQKGIPPQHVGAASLGEFHPVKRGSTSEARRQNRRIEIKITAL